MASKVIDVAPYLDTVAIVAKEPLSSAAGKKLREMMGDRLILGTSKSAYRYRITLHQPPRAALDVVAKVSRDHVVSRMDIAVDLIARTQQEAAEVGKFLEFHMTQKWHGERETRLEENTGYFGQRSTSRNIAVYSDRPSKTSGQPCVHVEFRFCGALSCQRIGVYSLGDITSLDPTTLIERNARLSIIVPKLLARRLDAMVSEQMRRTGRDRPTTRRLLVNHITRGFLQTEEGAPTGDWAVVVRVQLFLDGVRCLKTRLRSAIDLRLSVVSVSLVDALSNPT